jgi:hypothetical protein
MIGTIIDHLSTELRAESMQGSDEQSREIRCFDSGSSLSGPDALC